MGLTIKQIERVKQLRNTMTYDALLGNYKSFKKAKQEYASLAVQDFQTTSQIKTPPVKVPLFSKMGLNMLYVAVRNFFSKKTPDEKLLKKMGQEAHAKQKLNELI